MHKWKYFKETVSVKSWILATHKKEDFKHLYNHILKWAERQGELSIEVNMRYCEKCNKLQIETMSNYDANKFKKFINKFLNKDYCDFDDIRVKRENILKSLLK
jgi:hypothetical protein